MADTEAPASQILTGVENAIYRYGRPRKNPGTERPVAILKSGSEVKKLTPKHIFDVQHLSLPAAFRYVEIRGNYGKNHAEKAKRAFLVAHHGTDTEIDMNGFSNSTLEAEIQKIDQTTSNSRELTRNLRAARKKLNRLK